MKVYGITILGGQLRTTDDGLAFNSTKPNRAAKVQEKCRPDRASIATARVANPSPNRKRIREILPVATEYAH